jgi:hypothetical protein
MLSAQTLLQITNFDNLFLSQSIDIRSGIFHIDRMSARGLGLIYVS